MDPSESPGYRAITALVVGYEPAGEPLSNESARRTDRWIRVALVAAVLIAFGASLTFDFVVDDRWIVRGNEAIRGWSSLITLWGKPYWVADTTGSGGLYRPALMFVFALLWNSGLQFPFWFHLLAVVAHTIATLLVWQLLRRVVPRWPATLAALWFAVHPLHIEAVANVSNSSEVFVTIAALCLTLMLLRIHDRAPDEPISWTAAAGAGALFAVALLFKESGATIPALALVAVWGWHATTTARPLGVSSAGIAGAWRRWNRLVIVCALVFVGVVLARIHALGSMVSHGSIAAEGLDRLTTSQRVWAMLGLGPTIVTLLVWPTTLNPAYGPRFLDGHSGVSAPALAFVALVIAVIVVAVMLARRGDRRVLTGVAWAAIAFLPASNLLLPTGQILAERTLYLPSVGITLVIAAIVAAIASVARSAAVARRAGVLVEAAALVGLLTAANTTRHRSWAWRDHDAWFHQVIAANPSYFRGYLELALYQERRGQHRDAMVNLERAYQLAPRESRVLAEYSRELLVQGDTARAMRVSAELMSLRSESSSR